MHPGTFIHVPPTHAIRCGRLKTAPSVIYIAKIIPETMTGIAPMKRHREKALTVEEVQKKHAEGHWPGQEKDASKSGAIIEGLEECYYPVMDFGEPEHSGVFALFFTASVYHSAITNRRKDMKKLKNLLSMNVLCMS